MATCRRHEPGRPRGRRVRRLAAIALAGACALAHAQPLSAVAEVGRKAFFDASLSASGRLACATCHDPAHAHAPGNALAVQLGGARLDRPGARAVPSLRYLHTNGPLAVRPDGTVAGGFDWDGRASSLAAQAAGPLLDPNEMANRNRADVVAKLRRAPYADEFRRVFGGAVFARPAAAFARLAQALARYQIESPEFHPYDAKFDAVRAGRAQFTPAEARGQRVFEDPARGNCAACHTSAPGQGGAPPLFTDFTYDSTGVPRNRALAANAAPDRFDLGLCAAGPLRGSGRNGGTSRNATCGKFRVPTLRNVATRRAFFHNGRFASLREVLEFYARRDTEPQRWYPLDARGVPQVFDDLPPALRINVNRTEVPYDRKPGMAPAFDAADIDDLLQFLATLDDGWKPAPQHAAAAGQ